MATTETRVSEIDPQESLVYDGFISYSHAFRRSCEEQQT